MCVHEYECVGGRVWVCVCCLVSSVSDVPQRTEFLKTLISLKCLFD